MNTQNGLVKPPAVYGAINAVQAAMSREGISKDRKNQQQGYSFRGIDDVYGALAPHLAKEKLCILPRVIERAVTERENKSGTVLTYTVLRVEFDFVAVEDGSKHTVCTVGEAMDAGDKSTNKAMSAAYKYAAFQAFAIPTEGDNDADSTTHEVAKPKAKPQPAPLSDKTRKDLEFVIGTPKGAELWAKAAAKKGLTLDTIDEDTAQKALVWINGQTEKAA